MCWRCSRGRRSWLRHGVFLLIHTHSNPSFSYALRLRSLSTKCCSCTCSDGPDYECGPDVTDYCIDPRCSFDPVLVAEYPDCTGGWSRIDDGVCDAELNNAACGYDGGACCLCTCSGGGCAFNSFNCLDPDVGEEIFDCGTPPPILLPCSAGVQRTWLVDTSAQARALAAATNCSGGSFEVEWRGNVVVEKAIHVVNGTILTVIGDGMSSVIDGDAATRLFTVVNATLHLNGVSVSSGTSAVGGAIVAAAGSTLSLNQTSFVLNSATSSGGAIHVSGGSSVSCAGGGSFADNRATLDGGAMYVTGGSVVSCGGSWVNNTAGSGGGALGVNDYSTVSWDNEGASFASNTASVFGGAMYVADGSSVSWADESIFSNNFAEQFGGALAVFSANVSWTGETTVSGNRVGDLSIGGGVYVDHGSIRWTSKTEFANNTGGAISAFLSEVS